MPGAHVHSDVELNLFTGGGATYFMAGRFWAVPVGRLTLLWAGLPHRLVAVDPGSRYFCMTLPLAWFLGWGLDGLAARLFAGGIALGAEAGEADAGIERAQFGRWAAELAAGASPETRRIALLEVEACCRRLAQSTASEARPADTAVGGQVERMAEFIGRRFRDPLTVAEIADAAGLHPNYAAGVFKGGAGLSLWEYVTRLRVSHAQRLLLTTDWTVDRVARESGFGSPARFFAAFRRLVGETPRRYRTRNETGPPEITRRAGGLDAASG